MGQEVKSPPNVKKIKKKRIKRYYDYSLIFAILILIVFGLIMIFSASSYAAGLKFQDSAYFVKRQAIFAAGGFILMIALSFMDYRVWIRLSKLIFAVSTFLAGLVLIIGRDISGAKRWINLKFISFQPSELVKIGMILFLSYYLVKNKDKLHSEDDKSVRKELWKLFFIIMIPTVLIAKENLSTGIIIFLIAFCMSFLGTGSRKLHMRGAAAMLAGLIAAKPVVRLLYNWGIRDYRIMRLVVWADPEKFKRDGGYQVLQGLYAIGSGDMFGKGLGQGLQKYFLPESQNDMIFSIIVEEIGLFGAAIVLAVFIFIIYRMLIIAHSAAQLEGIYLVAGIMIHLSLQVILNIAVVTTVFPNTGVSLPFISYGGTSIIILLVEMSIVLSVARSIKLEY